jgi:hypothetical protein
MLLGHIHRSASAERSALRDGPHPMGARSTVAEADGPRGHQDPLSGPRGVDGALCRDNGLERVQTLRLLKSPA